MLDTSASGKYFVRVNDLPALPAIQGQIVFMREVSATRIMLSLTNNCQPDTRVVTLPPEANDDGWYNITPLILSANSLILPKYDRCVYRNATALSYRHHLDIAHTPITETQAKHQLCILGKINGRAVSLQKTAYYIADIDSNGYILAYGGFCQPLQPWEKPQIQQRVLRLLGSGRQLFLAKPIVDACNQAYDEDFNRALEFSSAITESVSASSVDAQATSERGTYMSQMRLT